MYKLASHESEGRLFHKTGVACVIDRFIGDLEMRKMRRIPAQRVTRGEEQAARVRRLGQTEK